MPIVLDAARTEFRKLDKPVTESEFRWIAPQCRADHRNTGGAGASEEVGQP